MKKYKKFCYLGIGLLPLVLASCGTTDSKNTTEKKIEQVATLTAGTPVQSLDPATAVDQTSITLLANVMEGLYRLDEKNQPQPALAAGQPKVSNDGKTYTIVIRDGAKWSDGTPITAEDFVVAWQRVVDPETASPNVELFSTIKNAKEIISGKQPKEKLGVKSNGEQTLIIELEEPTPYFTDLLALTAYFPVQQKAIKENGKNYGTSKKSIETNGAYTLTNLDGVGTSDKWTIAKNEKYWDKKNVSMKKINFQVVKEINTGINLYNDGQLDDTPLAGEYAKQYKKDKEYSTTLMANTMFLEMNQTGENKLLKNKNVRKAISYAIDRESLGEKLLDNGSIPSVGVVPKKMAYNPKTKKDFANEKLVEFNKKQASTYWKTAKSKDKVSEKLELDILVGDGEFEKKAGEFLQGQLEENLEGLKVNITPVPANVFMERLTKKDFNLSLSGWQADYADPISFLANFETNSPLNHGGYSNKNYDELIKDTSSKRWQELKKAEKILIDDMGVVPIFQVGTAKLEKSKIRNVLMHSIGAKYDYKKMRIEK
ncbi:peptide pheromone-binding protein TraC [Enterococcus faecalis]|uniref:peptide pheromone-binding protein TraC n=1 Tax=Enterococcus TaxID=1350 RepID=UPI0001E19CBC|nr:MULTISPECIES: peptide pheromone-binding protein TraC [Bacteria]EJG3828704.1 peptide pheromone-binding protein TraC [Listeria monocytogenes]EFM77774.1 ABC transporter, substrate-binding protein, family 5 [Enterococcus faecalis TX2134]EGO7961121.1 peptide pheromone-binding protein TraC [Enterococcus faecalis]EGO8497449.1 peptide ABC transporter substrate-binding protein [Enterococcus faecalis]EGO8962262.1 peptide ABC transporter substrate-binding protein [Enterococcus faecalis]